MEDFQHLMATDSFSQNWLQNTYAPFEFSYTGSESEAAECDDQGSVGDGSFNFSTQLPHWFHFGSEDGDVQLYADELFFDGFIKSPALLLQRSSSCNGERSESSLFVAKRDMSSVSSSPAAVVKCRFLRKWGRCAKSAVIRCWKVVECGVKSRKKSTRRSDVRSWQLGRHVEFGNGSVENPIHEAVLHCKRSSMGL